MGYFKNLAIAVLFGAGTMYGCNSPAPEKVHNKEVVQDTLDYSKLPVDSIDDVVMELDTSYSDMPSVQKEVAQGAYEKAKRFLAGEGIMLHEREGADLKFKFSNSEDFIEGFFPGNEFPEYDGSGEFPYFTEAVVSGTDSVLFEQSMKEVNFYKKFIRGLDTLYVDGEAVTDRVDLLKQATRSENRGWYDSKNNAVWMNVPALIHSEYLFVLDDNEEPPARHENLSDVLAVTTVHELGHAGGLAHVWDFPGGKDFVDGFGRNAMDYLSFLPEDYRNDDFDFYLTPLQVNMWKSALSEGTEFNRVFSLEPEFPDTTFRYIDSAYAEVNPLIYLGGDYEK